MHGPALLRRRHFVAAYIALAISWVGAPAPANSARAQVEFEPIESWRTALAGSDFVLSFPIPVDVAAEATIVWSLTAGGRVLVRGERSIPPADQARPPVAISLRMPELNEGVALATSLEVGLYADPGGSHRLTWQGPIQLLHRNPFFASSRWLKELNIDLFDPEKKTAAVFEQLGVPYRAQNNVNALSHFTGSMLVVGAGLDFNQYRGLWPTLLDLTKQGKVVFVLAPAAGSLELPTKRAASVTDAPLPDLDLRDCNAIANLDGKLDHAEWPPHGTVVKSSLILEARGTTVAVRIADGDIGWPWIELKYPGRGGRVIVCGFAIVDTIDAAATPRHLLARIIEDLAEWPDQVDQATDGGKP